MPPKVRLRTDTRDAEAAAIAHAALRAALEVAGGKTELAHLCGVDRTTVSRWSNGNYPVDLALVMRPRKVRRATVEAMAAQLGLAVNEPEPPTVRMGRVG